MNILKYVYCEIVRRSTSFAIEEVLCCKYIVPHIALNATYVNKQILNWIDSFCVYYNVYIYIFDITQSPSFFNANFVHSIEFKQPY